MEENENVICCGILEKMEIRWMYIDDETKVLPHLLSKEGDTRYKVNYCPSCGKDIAGIQIKIEK